MGRPLTVNYGKVMPNLNSDIDLAYDLSRLRKIQTDKIAPISSKNGTMRQKSVELYTKSVKIPT